MDCCIPDPPQKQSRSTPRSGCLKMSTLVLQADWPFSEMSEMDKAFSHGSGKWLYLKGNYYWVDPFLTSMTMGERVYGDFIIPIASRCANAQPFHSLKKLPFRLFRYASKIAVANNYNKECRVLIENGDKDGEVPPDTIVEPCQIHDWLYLPQNLAFQASRVLSWWSACVSQFSCCNMKICWCQPRISLQRSLVCHFGGLNIWGGCLVNVRCVGSPKIYILNPFVCDCFTPSTS